MRPATTRVPGASGVSFDNPHEMILFITVFAGQGSFPGVRRARGGGGNGKSAWVHKNRVVDAIIASGKPAPEVLAHTGVTLFGRRTSGEGWDGLARRQTAADPRCGRTDEGRPTALCC